VLKGVNPELKRERDIPFHPCVKRSKSGINVLSPFLSTRERSKSGI